MYVADGISRRFQHYRDTITSKSKAKRESVVAASTASVAVSGAKESGYDGISLKPVLLGTGNPANRSGIFSYSPHGPVKYSGATLTTNTNWKIIRRFARNLNRTSVYELYNLAEDIGENNDLVDSHPRIVKQLSRLLEKFIAETNSLEPILNPRYNHSEAVELGIGVDISTVRHRHVYDL